MSPPTREGTPGVSPQGPNKDLRQVESHPSPWKGRYVCPDCGEVFYFYREADRIPGFEDRFVQVAHDHSLDPPAWVLSVFDHRKGEHRPPDVRALRLAVDRQKKAALERGEIEKGIATMNGAWDDAQEVAWAGHPVFPAGRNKKPMGTPHGVNDATTDATVIDRWSQDLPDANYGIATENGRLVAIEVDPYQGGSLRRLRELLGPDAVACISASGRGHHVFVRSINVKNATKLGDGITVRSDGYYVIGPGSIHETDRRYGRRRYGWERFRMGDLPDVTVNGAVKAVVKEARRDWSAIPEGDRHATLVTVAATMGARGVVGEPLFATLLATRDTLAAQGGREVTDEEVRSIAGWVTDKEASNGTVPFVPEPRAPSPTGVTLADVHEVFRKGMHLPDATVVDVAIAATVANLQDTDPVFLMVVGAASRGKTEAIDALRLVPEVYPLSELTPATLLSGHRDPKQRGKDPSLLPRLTGQGKRVMLLKDFGTVLSMHGESRAQVMAQLREVFDGSLVKATGMGDELSWEGHMGFIAGATPKIDEHYGAMTILGDRFVYLRVPDVDRSVTNRTALRNRGAASSLRQERREVVASFVASVDVSGGVPPLSDHVLERLDAVSDYATRIRTAVSRDGFSREVVNLPELEAPMRLAKQLAAIFDALRLLGYDEARALETVERMARDSVPPIRVRCLEDLRIHGVSKTRDLAERTGLPTTTARRALEDLALVGVLSRERKGEADNAADLWQILGDGPEAFPTYRE